MGQGSSTDYAARIQQEDAVPMSLEEKVAGYFALRDHAFSVPVPPTAAPECPRHMWQRENGTCSLCDKWCDGSHELSAAHVKRSKQAKQLDLLAGPRPFRTLFVGMPIPPDFHVTQRNMLHYWGPNP